MLLVESACILSFTTLRSAADGLRCHANGIPRAMIDLRRRCTTVVVNDAFLQHGCVGIRTHGGRFLTFDDVTITDFDCTAVIQRDFIPGNLLGSGIDGGANALPDAEFALEVVFHGVMLEGCRHPDETQASWYLHDMVQVTLNSCTITNHGMNPVQPGATICGLLMSDTSGSSDEIVIDGVQWPIRTRNVNAAVTFGDVAINDAPGTGGISLGALRFDHRGIGPQFDRLTLANTVAVMMTDVDFNAHPDWTISIARYQIESFVAENLVIAHVNDDEHAFATGEIAELDPSAPPGEVHLRTPAGPTRAAAVVCTGTGNSAGTGYVMVSILPETATVLCSVDGVTTGDLLVVSATYPRRAEVDNAPADPFTVSGKALGSKPAGAEGLVRIGPA